MDSLTAQGMLDAVTAFHERLEMMVSGFIVKHGRRPKLVFADRMAERGWMATFVSPELFDPDASVHPKLAEFARHADRAWRQWTRLEPDEVVVLLRIVGPGETSLTIIPRTQELKVQIAGEVIRDMDRKARQS